MAYGDAELRLEERTDSTGLAALRLFDQRLYKVGRGPCAGSRAGTLLLLPRRYMPPFALHPLPARNVQAGVRGAAHTFSVATRPHLQAAAKVQRSSSWSGLVTAGGSRRAVMAHPTSYPNLDLAGSLGIAEEVPLAPTSHESHLESAGSGASGAL